MAFRVEITEQAERDGHAILDWLISEHAGETGLRWFEGLEKPSPLLPPSPPFARSPLKTPSFPLRYGTCSTDASRTSTGFCSPSTAKRFLSCTYATDADRPSSIDGKPRRNLAQ